TGERFNGRRQCEEDATRPEATTVTAVLARQRATSGMAHDSVTPHSPLVAGTRPAGLSRHAGYARRLDPDGLRPVVRRLDAGPARRLHCRDSQRVPGPRPRREAVHQMAYASGFL